MSFASITDIFSDSEYMKSEYICTDTKNDKNYD